MNIYIRNQDPDLFKYLSDEDMESLAQELDSSTIPAGGVVFSFGEKPEYIVMLIKGELDIISASGKSIGCIFPGEIAGEDGFVCNTTSGYTLKAVQESRIEKISYAALNRFMSAKPELSARIHAAINDTLCQKIIRVTHTGNEHG